MTDEPNRYDVADALALMALAPAGSTDDALKGMLASASDIPADRIDFAFSELRQGLPVILPLVMLYAAAHGRPPTTAELAAMLPGSMWIDDSKGEATYNLSVVDDAGNEAASATIKARC